ncbi:MAG: hypothetical protein HY718_14265 [Planctomycetes bacterium]|nr:hypothetical protein [Planctomycetota bacterium]
MSKLPYLVAEVNAAMEVYLSGRTGQQYNRTAFILCDDGAELASKLFLITETPGWSDKKPNNHFKRFGEVTGEVRAVFVAKRNADHAGVDTLLKRIEARRDRRNDFFHSTHLLDLNFHARDCVEAFVELLDYGKLLFPADPRVPNSGWDGAVAAVGNMETCEAILRIDQKSYGDPAVTPKLNSILKGLRRTGEAACAKGCEVAHHPEDYHLRLAIRNGGKTLRDRLRALL